MDNGTMNHSMMEHNALDSHVGHGSYSSDHIDHSNHVPSADNGHSGHSPHYGMSMQMYFYSSCEATILFKQWQVSTWQGMLGSCVVVFILAALYEGLKVGRELLLRKTATAQRYAPPPAAPNTPDNHETLIIEPPLSHRMCSIAHSLQSLLHILQVLVSYLLMLIAMTYNVWLCAAVCLGAGAGYLLFSWRRQLILDVNEHCH